MEEEGQSWAGEEQRLEERSWRWAEAEEWEEEPRQQQEEQRELHQDPELLREVAAVESSWGCWRCCYRSPFPAAAAVDCCWQKGQQGPGKDAATAAGHFPLSMLCSS